jgi:hypothetical protein
VTGPGLHNLVVPGAMLARGFWLYVWKVNTPSGEFLYVGRTGDSSSPNATPPYQRMGQHLGHQPTQNALRKHLKCRGIEAEHCMSFKMTAFGPLFDQQPDMTSHKVPRDIVAALEKKLADSLNAAGHDVLNTVKCRMPLDLQLWNTVRAAFAIEYPRLLTT